MTIKSSLTSKNAPAVARNRGLNGSVNFGLSDGQRPCNIRVAHFPDQGSGRLGGGPDEAAPLDKVVVYFLIAQGHPFEIADKSTEPGPWIFAGTV